MRRIAHLSDLHFGTETTPVLAELGRSVAAFAPDLVVVTGDLTQRARVSEFQNARRFLDSLAFAQLVVPGNHDIAPLYRPLRRLLRPYARYHHFITAQLDGAFYDDEVLVMGLSSVQPLRWKEGTISRRQLQWVAEYAQRFPDQLRILAAHHPLVEAETDKPTRRLRQHGPLMSVLDSADVSICLSGHLHKSFTGLAATPLDEAGSVLAVHASTATSTRLRGHQNAYNQLTIDGPRLRVDAIGYDGEGFRPIASSSFERRVGVWHRLVVEGREPLATPASARAGP
jgi:3',5'-cyclic AMP phosphodiesterase CpdA